MRYDHVIWDWNGTLFDDVDLVVEIADLMLVRRSLPGIDRRRYLEIFGFPVRGYYERVGFDLEQESFEKLSLEFIVEYQKRWCDHQLRSEAYRVIDWLEKRGVTQSVLSASEQVMLETVTAYFRIADRMTALIGTENHHAVSKLEQGLAHIQNLSMPRSRILLVGDTEHDYEVADAIGIDCALVTEGHAPRERLEATGMSTFDSLTKLVASLE